MDYQPKVRNWAEEIEKLLKNTHKRKIFLYIRIIKGTDFADIARYVRISHTNLTKHIKDFEFMKLLKSEVSLKDRRKKIYVVTPLGEDFIRHDIRSIGMFLDMVKVYLDNKYSGEGEDAESRAYEAIGRYFASLSGEPFLTGGPFSEAGSLFLYFLRYSRRIVPQDVKNCLFFSSEERNAVLRLIDAAMCSKNGCSVCNLILDSCHPSLFTSQWC